MQKFALRNQADCDALSEAVLIGLARQGEESAVRALIKRNNRRLFRVALAVVRDNAEAEDIVQETYVRAFTGLGSFRGDAALSTWLTRIALNEALGQLRRRRPTTGLEELDTARGPGGGQVIMFPISSAPESPFDQLARGQMRKLLEQAVDDLPEAFRIVFILRDIEEMSAEETAGQLALKVETVKTRLHRARRLLRTALEKRLSTTFSELFPVDGARCERMVDRVVARLKKAVP